MQDRRRFLQGMAAATSVGVAGCAWRFSIEAGTEWIRTHTRMAVEEVGKPAYLGEFGVEVDRLGSEVKEGTDGAMVWDLRTEAEYSSTSSWNLHAIYPRDEATVGILNQYSAELAGLSESS